PDFVPHHLRFHPYHPRPVPTLPGSQLNRGFRVRRPPRDLPPSGPPRDPSTGRDDHTPEGGM
ncbi:unnamed protein product, partial [Allacma fusca]